jgi:hypothetical protein
LLRDLKFLIQKDNVPVSVFFKTIFMNFRKRNREKILALAPAKCCGSATLPQLTVVFLLTGREIINAGKLNLFIEFKGHL